MTDEDSIKTLEAKLEWLKETYIMTIFELYALKIKRYYNDQIRVSQKKI